MRRTVKKWLFCCALTAACLLVTGCSFKLAASPEDLYSLPQLPAEYTELNNCIKALLDGGAEYAAPISGTNTQSVQLVDLNGSGQEEALAFLRNSSEEKPLKIYIFSPTGHGYEQSAVIEGNGTSFYSVSYRDLDGDGEMELLIGWKVGADQQALTVYTLRNGKPEELLRTNYVKYAVTNLDERRPESELVVFQADDEGNSVADFYTWEKDGGLGTLSKTSSARLSMTMAELNAGRVSSGFLRDGVPALFVSGVSDSSVEITDILLLREGEMTNAVLSDTTGVTTELFRYQFLFPMDINGDNITEVPAPTPLPSHGNLLEFSYLISWRSYDQSGVSTTVGYTYHNNDDGWYLEVPEKWVEKIVATRSRSAADEIAVTFSVRGVTEEDDRDFLRIYTITGDSRDIKATRGDRIILGRQAETIYAAELLSENSQWSGGIQEDDLRSRFKLITSEWRPGDN